MRYRECPVVAYDIAQCRQGGDNPATPRTSRLEMPRHLDAAGPLTDATQEIGPCLEREVLHLDIRRHIPLVVLGCATSRADTAIMTLRDQQRPTYTKGAQ